MKKLGLSITALLSLSSVGDASYQRAGKEIYNLFDNNMDEVFPKLVAQESVSFPPKHVPQERGYPQTPLDPKVQMGEDSQEKTAILEKDETDIFGNSWDDLLKELKTKN